MSNTMLKPTPTEEERSISIISWEKGQLWVGLLGIVLFGGFYLWGIRGSSRCSGDSVLGFWIIWVVVMICKYCRIVYHQRKLKKLRLKS